MLLYAVDAIMAQPIGVLLLDLFFHVIASHGVMFSDYTVEEFAAFALAVAVAGQGGGVAAAGAVVDCPAHDEMSLSCDDVVTLFGI